MGDTSVPSLDLMSNLAETCRLLELQSLTITDSLTQLQLSQQDSTLNLDNPLNHLNLYNQASLLELTPALLLSSSSCKNKKETLG